MKNWQFEVLAESGIGLAVASLAATVYVCHELRDGLWPVINAFYLAAALITFCCLAVMIFHCYWRRTPSALLHLWQYAILTFIFIEGRIYFSFLMNDPGHWAKHWAYAAMPITLITARLLRLRAVQLETSGEDRIEP